MTFDPGITQQLPSPPRRTRRNLWIAVLVAGCGVLTCCLGVSAVSAVTGHRQAPRPATPVDTRSAAMRSGVGPSYSPVPPPSPSSSPPAPAAPAPAMPAPARPVPPPPAAAPTAQDPPPADDAGTPTVAGIRAGQFCKRVLAGTYAYDDKGELLFCGPAGATHPRWSHA